MGKKLSLISIINLAKFFLNCLYSRFYLRLSSVQVNYKLPAFLWSSYIELGIFMLSPSELADFLHLLIGAFLPAGFYHYCCLDPGGRATQPGLPSSRDAGLCLLEHQVPLPPPRHHSQEYSGTHRPGYLGSAG
jgi:hypothetical protein